ncbi:protein phosphatase 2C domain-containing protein [Saccharothrix sp.]|uniref:PP2C family protein-serine/threonine phosphatase n=1 Tax=Saccharothrix sp. TaxID=1873460 RepID=UPI0028126425|nr:protein phosphatase 2C domain-containing protein [Saccharothrix sp.]
MTPCARCAGTVAPDGHCWDCGLAQSDFRAHVESIVDGAAFVTDRGLRRAVNADAVVLTAVGEWTVGVVCDGVSLSARPERAAQVAAEAGAATLVKGLAADTLPETALTDSVAHAARAVTALAGGPSTLGVAPAATYVAAVVGPQGLWAAGVGDSRAYWLPDEGPGVLLTEDDTGEHDALTAWLGADAPDPHPLLRSHRPPGPGRVLLCTDGLTRYLADPADLRTAAGTGDSLHAASALVAHALTNGGHDNVTAALIPFRPPSP